MKFELSANGTMEIGVDVFARPGTFNAHYPVRLDAEFELNGETVSAHIIQVVETDIVASTSREPEYRLNVVPERGGLALATLDTYRGVWNYENQSVQMLPIGFQGMDEKSGASIARHPMDRGGVTRQSIGMHPPWRSGIGNVAAEYRVKLPTTKPISMSFFSAMRDTAPPETPSDGVTYRIKVDGKTIYEKHDAETDWVAHEVNLSEFAGQEILLTLESNPGPRGDTNCDACYWGDVILFAGVPAKTLTAEEKQAMFAENLQAVKTGKSDVQRTLAYYLDGGLTGAVTFGNNGFIDGVIGLGNAEQQVQFDGLRVWVKGQLIGALPSAVSVSAWTPREPATVSPSRNQWVQEIATADCKGTLFFSTKANGSAVQFMIDASADDLITRIEFGPATHHAEKVYYGHGYCIVEPEAFTAHADGHNLSTSHVGMDFDNGLSILQATSFPPDSFIVNPKTKRYTLSVHPATTMTLLPGTKGAFDCAIRYRSLHEGKPAPGVKTKAGRFVFDIWGGRYKDHLETIRFAQKYGLTDSMLIVHNWQHYGYDNRLPDIYPPNPTLGTLEEMQETLKLCDSLGILYAIHDNYIDFYPDADEYSFDVTAFNDNGQPRRGWNNYGIEAQAYQFRPDHVQRFLERNLDLIVPNLPVSAYFVDVFSSMPPIDYYDRDGKFHSRAKTRQHWAQAFDTIREKLSLANKHFPSAVTVSESGMDSLIGHLDGSDSNFMFISPEPGDFRISIKCKEWSRVPWYNAVHHTKFSLHGVGYSSRYEAQRGRAIHGIESDDYISAEILTGHALMVDDGSARRGAVRKYWLAQNLVRHLADKEIVNVEFVDGNVQRQKITWTGNVTVWVNLGKEDWTINPPRPYEPEVALPHYGYFAIYDGNHYAGYSSIYKQEGRVVESSGTWDRVKDSFTHYYNARQKNVEKLLPITPTLHSFQYLDGNRFTVSFKWNVKEPPTQDLSVFIHCVERQRAWHHHPADVVLGGGVPAVPTSLWSGEVITENFPVMAIPDEFPAGRHYLTVGLYDQKGNGQRAKLIGFSADTFFGAGSNRYVVGWLNVERKDGKVSNITLEPFEWDEAELYERLLPPKEPVEMFSFCKTKGGFKVEMARGKNTAVLTPLPDEPEMEIASTLAAGTGIKSIKAIDATGKELRDVPFTFDASKSYPLVFTTQAGEYAYKIVW